MNKRIFLFAATGIILCAVIIAYFLWEKRVPTVKIGTTIFQVLIADSETERIQGLSGRASLYENEGMLFLYPQPATAIFWMNDMRFDLDFIFMRNGAVVDVAENIPHPEGDGPPETIATPEKFDAVLEAPAGSVQRFSIRIGDTATYSL